MAVINLFNRKVGDGAPVLIIAEIGLNHQGRIDLAHRLIDIAADAGADVIKFHKRSMPDLYQKKLLENPNLGEQGFEYLLPILKESEQIAPAFKEIKAHVEERKKKFLCTPWDPPSVDFLEQLAVEAYKIGSPDNTNFLLIEKVVATGKPIIISTAFVTEAEIEKIVAFLRDLKVPFALLHCVGAYPTPPEDQNLRFMVELKRRYPDIPIGYSSHERGFYSTLAAVALGATVVERHITLDRTMEGPDHVASLEPDELKRMVEGIREIEHALGAPKKILSHIEAMNRKVLGKSLVAAVAIPKGATLEKQMLISKSPAKGIAPYRIGELLGKIVSRDIAQDELFMESDLGIQKKIFVRPNFKTPWALKSRFSEIDFVEKFDPQIFEFHLSDKDLDEYMYWVPKKKYAQGLYLHAPDYMGRRLKDLCSPDPEHWEASIAFFQRTIDLARRLAPYFTGVPRIIVHVGGMSMDTQTFDLPAMYARAEAAFRRLHADGVELLPENMPPHGWYFAGQWYNHAFLDATELVDFARRLNLKVCFDTAHAKLACNVFKKNYREFVETVAPYTAYVQVADAAGPHSESIQIGEGEIDFVETFGILNRFPGWTWCPEIWEGHLHEYEGFLTALERLKPYIT